MEKKSQYSAVHYDLVRRMNTLRVITCFQNLETATKSEIARQTGLSIPTVGAILNSLIEAGEILQQGLDSPNGGRPAERFEICPLNTLTLGIALNLHGSEYVIADSLGTILERHPFDTESENTVSIIENIIEEALEAHPAVKIISIGVPSSINDGVICFSPRKFKSLNDINLGRYIREKYQLPVIVENDLNAIVQGQYLREYDGVTGGLVHFFITADGVGLGINVNGQLVRGNTGLAGETGFLPCCNGRNVRDATDEATTRKELIEIVANVLASVSCILNPHYFFISGERIDPDMLPEIKAYASKIWPDGILPEVKYANDVMGHYLNGLIDMARKEIYSPDNYLVNVS